MPDIKITYSNGFNFNGQSPALRIVRAEIQLARQKGRVKVKDFAEAKRASTSCINNWMTGKTRRPQFDKIAGVADLLGFDIVFKPKRGGGGNSK